MKAEYDFSNAEQSKFYNDDATFHYPIYLETDVDQFLQKIADNKNIDLQILSSSNEKMADKLICTSFSSKYF